MSSILKSLGVTFPGQQIKGDIHNPEGYFEWDEVVALQEKLLIDLDRWWPSHKGSFYLPENWLEEPLAQHAYQCLRRILLSQLNCQEGVLAIKDPRTSLLLPLWIRLTKELQIPISVILAVRNPAEVAASLISRDGEVTGMNLTRAQNLWLKHNLDVLTNVPDEVRLSIIHYSDWFDNPKKQLEILLHNIDFLKPSEEKKTEALSCIRNELYRNSKNLPMIRRGVKKLYKDIFSDDWINSKNFYLYYQYIDHKGDILIPPPSIDLINKISCWDDWIRVWSHYPAPCFPKLLIAADQLNIKIFGLTIFQWQIYYLLQKLPIEGFEDPTFSFDDEMISTLIIENNKMNSNSQKLIHKIALNFEYPVYENRKQWVDELSEFEIIWDPDSARVNLLRSLGLNAFYLDINIKSNKLLDQPLTTSLENWLVNLGLPCPPKNVVCVLGDVGSKWNKALAYESKELSKTKFPKISYFPGWNELIINTPEAAIHQARWIEVADKNCLKIVWTDSNNNIPNTSVHIKSDTTPTELRNYLLGLQNNLLVEDRDLPISDKVYTWESSMMPKVSVLVSLFNYSNKILNALNSIASQSQNGIELIVVDDNSTDQSVKIVHDWMVNKCLANPNPFASIKLLSHRRNTGLATTRNTAFFHACSEWCFVLDADNEILPNGILECLQLVSDAPDCLAVIHPLIEVQSEFGKFNDNRSIISPKSWQRDHFKEANFVDAMALVRRSAWKSVGGYTHIEHGWEDYDFWCKLIEGGYHGVQCPYFAAVYNSHDNSMTKKSTQNNYLNLETVIQSRHSWLDKKK